MADSGSGGFQFNSSNGQDALNLAAAYNAVVTSKTNNLIDLLRIQQAQTLKNLIAASYSAANAMMYQAVFEAASSSVVGVGGMMCLNEVNTAQTSVKGVKKEEANLQKSQKTAQDEFKKMDDETQKTSEGTKLKEKIDNNEKALNAKKSEREAKEKLATEKSQNANQKAGILQTAAPGMMAMPKALQDNIKAKADAVQTIMQQINQMESGSYDKSNQTLQSFFNINFFAALVALGSLQLR